MAVSRIPRRVFDEMAEAATCSRRPLPEKIVGKPIELKPIPWGKPDPELGRGVCHHMAEVNAPTVIPFNPLTESKLHSLLRSLRIVHH